MTLSTPVPIRAESRVLGGGDEDALAHEAGGVADLGDVAAGGGDFEVVEVGPAEENAAAAGGGQQPHLNGSSAVQADSGKLYGVGYGLFEMTAFRQTATSFPNPRYCEWVRRHRLMSEDGSFSVVYLPQLCGYFAHKSVPGVVQVDEAGNVF